MSKPKTNWEDYLNEYISTLPEGSEDLEKVMKYHKWLSNNFYVPTKRIVPEELEAMDNSVYLAEQKLENYLVLKFPDIEIRWIHEFVDSFNENWFGQELVDELSNFEENDKRFAGFREVNKF